MTTQTIRNGQAIELAIPSGQILAVVAVSGTYSASITSGAGIGVIATNATGGTYGPYTGGGATIRLTSSLSSEVDFDVGTTTNVVSDTYPTLTTNPLTGGGIALVGAGGPIMNLTGVSVRFNKTPSENALDMQASLDWLEANGGGVLRLDTAQNVMVDRRLILGTGVTLDLNGSTITQIPGTLDNIAVTRSYVEPWVAGGTISWTSGLTALVNHPAHGNVVGDYVSTSGVMPSAFLICGRVTAATADTFTLTLWRIPSAAPTGTLLWKKACQNVKICNGTVVSGAPGNVDIEMLAHGIIGAYVRTFKVENVKTVNILKYGVFGFSVDDINVDTTCETRSDGCHIFGPARNGRMRVSGKFGDDCMAVSSRDLIGNWVDVSGGDVIDMKAYGGHGQSTTALFQIFAHAGYEMDDIHYISASGDSPNFVSIYCDPTDGGKLGILTLEGGVANSRCVIDYYSASAAGFVIRELILKNIAHNPKTDTLTLIETGVNSVSIEKLVIENTKVDAQTSWGVTGEAIFFKANCTVRNAEFRGGYIRGGQYGIVWKSVGNNNLRTLSFTGMMVQGIDCVFKNTSTVTDNPKIVFDKCSLVQLKDVAALYNNADVTLRDCNLNLLTSGAIHLYHANANAVRYHQSGSQFISSNEVVIDAGSIVPSKTPGVSMNITQATRSDGAQVYNTNATANNGTDGATGAGPFVCIGTATGSWKRLGTTGGAGNQF